MRLTQAQRAMLRSLAQVEELYRAPVESIVGSTSHGRRRIKTARRLAALGLIEARDRERVVVEIDVLAKLTPAGRVELEADPQT